MSAPRSGDQVRLVFEGTWDDDGVALGDGYRFYPALLASRPLSIEVVQPALPTAFGSVIEIRGHGYRLVLRKDGHWQFLHNSCGVFPTKGAVGVRKNFRDEQIDVLFDAGA